MGLVDREGRGGIGGGTTAEKHQLDLGEKSDQDRNLKIYQFLVAALVHSSREIYQSSPETVLPTSQLINQIKIRCKQKFAINIMKHTINFSRN